MKPYVLTLILALFMMIQPAFAQTMKIVAFGDSLTAGYGLAENESFAAQLEAALEAKGHDVDVINAGVSGDTTSMGLERIDWSVPSDADGVIVELGANDMLRGLSPDQARENLDEILTRLGEKDLPVLLAGMYAARNLGEEYVASFEAIFPDLAEKHGTLLYPFFMDGVAGERSLVLEDGLHPTAEGVALIVTNILPKVEDLIDRIEAAKAG